jgi:hypothetical protein
MARPKHGNTDAEAETEIGNDRQQQPVAVENLQHNEHADRNDESVPYENQERRERAFGPACSAVSSDRIGKAPPPSVERGDHQRRIPDQGGRTCDRAPSSAVAAGIFRPGGQQE